MLGKEQIVVAIKSAVLQVLPDAKVILFGSQVNQTAHDESDWDILVLINSTVTPKMKQMLHNTIFPLSVSAGVFINFLLVAKKDWQQSPFYYSLKNSISNNSISI